MLDFMVVDYHAHDYLIFKTEQEARDWVNEQIATGENTANDFAVFSRNLLAFK